LYTHLRKESLATGSLPITVRHLESTIRMAEASAKMHLREFVRADDINMAIKVTVGSFVSAQKMSIKKSLERAFRKYVTLEQDHEELLSFLLGQIIKEKARSYQATKRQAPPKISVQTSELEERAREHEIFDMARYLRSKVFKTNGYTLRNGVIEKSFISKDSEL